LQNIANNLPDAFSDYKSVTKSLYLARNMPERVEVPNKITQPLIGKRGGEALSRGKMRLLANKRRLEMQLNLWLKNT
jgi:hypothetical protein